MRHIFHLIFQVFVSHNPNSTVLYESWNFNLPLDDAEFELDAEVDR